MEHLELEISVVSPVYRAETLLPELVARLDKTLGAMGVSYELILVDDRSPDDSWTVLKQLAEKNASVKAYRLSRNFGQHNAISAGIDLAKGKYVVVMDCDLQDRPEEIQGLYNKITEEKVEVVLARRTERQDSLVKKFVSKAFYAFFHLLTGVKMDGTVANFGIYGPNIMSEYRKLKEPDRSFPFLIGWLGFSKVYFEVTHAKRGGGTTSYSYAKLFRLAFDIILAFSDRPIQIILQVGIFAMIFQTLAIMMGFSEMFFVDFQAILSSIQIIAIGILGMYLIKVYNATKRRPLYIIESKTEGNGEYSSEENTDR